MNESKLLVCKHLFDVAEANRQPSGRFVSKRLQAALTEPASCTLTFCTCTACEPLEDKPLIERILFCFREGYHEITLDDLDVL